MTPVRKLRNIRNILHKENTIYGMEHLDGPQKVWPTGLTFDTTDIFVLFCKTKRVTCAAVNARACVCVFCTIVQQTAN